MTQFVLGQATVHDIGINVGEYITAAIETLGPIVGIAVGGYAAFIIVKMALRWFRTAGAS